VTPPNDDEGPPTHFDGRCRPIAVADPVTMTPERRVRPQALIREDGQLKQMLFTTDGEGDVAVSTGLASTDDGGYTWQEQQSNPVLGRIESQWQGVRAFVTAVTREESAGRWVVATVGNDADGPTPGKRAVGLWFSEDRLEWTQCSDNPIVTVDSVDAEKRNAVLPTDGEDPVGMYLRDFRQIDGTWYALVQWRSESWSTMTVMESEGDVTGPWSLRNRCLDPASVSEWFGRNARTNWCQPVRVGDRFYAVCQNGVGGDCRDNDRLGLVTSEDYVEWTEADNPVTEPLVRPDGTSIVSSQQFLLPPEDEAPWRILLGARGELGTDSFTYLLEPTDEVR
jgi:hypothetical protein